MMTITALRPIGSARVRTDAELVEAARRQEPGAYGELFRRWYDRSYDVALNILRDRDAAADVAQDVLLAGWERLSDLRDAAAFGGWILRATRNRALNRVTRDRFRRMEQIDASQQGPALRDPEADPAVHAERSAQRRLIWTAAAALGERDTSLIDLHLRHGLGPSEIAEELQVTPNNAKQLLFQLRRKLREAVGAVLLWRDGRPTCAALATLVAETGRFDGRVARTIRRHERDCETCRRELARQTDPERLFASVPFAVAPVLLKYKAVTVLTQAGIPAMTPAATAAPPAVLPGPPIGPNRMPAIAGLGLVTLSIVSAIAVTPLGSGPHPVPLETRSAVPYASVDRPLADGPQGSPTGQPGAGPTTSGTGAPPSTRGPGAPPSTSGSGAPGTMPGTPVATRPPGSVAVTAPSAGVTPDRVPFCRYRLDASSGGNGQFTGSITITNISGTGWRGWTGAFTLATTMRVHASWGGTFQVSGTSVALTPTASTSDLRPGGSVVVGLAGNTASGIPQISGFAVQGHLCQGR